MKIEATTPEQYIEQLPDERKEAISKLRKVILENLPQGFTEAMSYGMIGYVVPKSVYPAGYHSNPELPLPFINLASQKTTLQFIILVYIPTKSLWTGFFRNIQNTAKQSWIWEKAV